MAIGARFNLSFGVRFRISPAPIRLCMGTGLQTTGCRSSTENGIPAFICSDREFEEHVLHCIDVMTRIPDFVLGVAVQVVPGSSEKRIRRVRELVNRYGRYPF